MSTSPCTSGCCSSPTIATVAKEPSTVTQELRELNDLLVESALADSGGFDNPTNGEFPPLNAQLSKSDLGQHDSVSILEHEAEPEIFNVNESDTLVLKVLHNSTIVLYY